MVYPRHLLRNSSQRPVKLEFLLEFIVSYLVLVSCLVISLSNLEERCCSCCYKVVVVVRQEHFCRNITAT